MGDLTRDAVLGRIETRKAEVKAFEVPEWEGTIYVRKLSIGDLRRADSLANGTDNSSAIVKNLVLGVCDAQGEPLFTKADAKRLMDADLAIATRISAEINSFNGMGETEVSEAAEDFAEAQDDGKPSE